MLIVTCFSYVDIIPCRNISQPTKKRVEHIEEPVEQDAELFFTIHFLLQRGKAFPFECWLALVHYYSGNRLPHKFFTRR